MRNIVTCVISLISPLWIVSVTASAFMLFKTASVQAQALTTLYTFCGSGTPCMDASTPTFGGLVQGADGDFYGTTYNGGAQNSGAVFKITPTGVLTILYSFCSQTNCTDGSNPYGGLVQGSDGNFYGTTSLGGATATAVGAGSGTVFQITPGGSFTTLYSFCSQMNCSDGIGPRAGLVQGSDGNFYGTTFEGGTTFYGTNAGGTIFRISSTGAFTTIYNFCSQNSCLDGEAPGAPLVLGSDGNFYGTTGSSGANYQGGTVFKITPTGELTTLYSFCSQSGCTDGANPEYSGLVQASDGNFYGTTINGGTNGNGTVFEITSDGTFTDLYSFTCSSSSICPNGRYPYGGLIQGSDGNLYGTTRAGGGNNGDFGTVFKMTLSGTLTTIYSFCSQYNCTDGGQPYAPVIEGLDGDLYGNTSQGGTGYGTVFSLATHLLGNPSVTLSATSLNFGMYQIGGAYPIPQVKLTNSGNGALAIASIQKIGANPSDFSESDNCPVNPNTLAAGNVCTITPNFAPAHLGALSAAISIIDNASDSPQSINLSGTAVDFTVSAVPLSNTIKGGKAASYTVSITPLGGNTMTAGLTVTGCPANANCTLSSSQFTLKGSTATNITLTVKGNGKTPRGSYMLTISGTVFTVTHSTSVGLVVQ